MSEKEMNNIKLKLKARGLRMDNPFSKATGFLICWKDEQTDERRTSLSIKWSDAVALYYALKKSTLVDVWQIQNGSLTGLAMTNCSTEVV